jgi:signal peptidase
MTGDGPPGEDADRDTTPPGEDADRDTTPPGEDADGEGERDDTVYPAGRDDVTGATGGDRTGDDAPAGRGPVALFRRFWTAEEGPLVLLREVLSSVVMVLLVAGLLFGLSGVWPPMVAVKSGSMNPHMQKGDLVFVTEEHRFTGQAAVEGTGVVPKQVGRESGHQKFGKAGDVIVYRPNNATRADPIIHRAMFYVEAGENWYDRANETHVRARACEVDENPRTDTGLQNCPAPNAGFITKGDNPETNERYDQAQGMSRPVKPGWIEAKAMVRIPALGWIRLAWSNLQAGIPPATLALVAGAGLVGRRRPGA